MKKITKEHLIKVDDEDEGLLFMLTNQAEGAYPKGARIEKVFSEDGDIHKIGDKGTVISSVDIPEQIRKKSDTESQKKSNYAYFVEWDDLLGETAFVLSYKIKKI